MKAVDIIFLYGLPGAGKLTIAKKVLKLTGDRFKLFHNQMTVDIISPIIPFPHPRGFKLNLKYRQLMIDACADLDIHLVLTYVYAQEDREDDEFVQFVLKKVEESGGTVTFVHLICDEEIIFKRIQNEDRKQYRKVSDPEKLKVSMERWELTKPIPDVDNLTVDTGKTSPDAAARIIVDYYRTRM